VQEGRKEFGEGIRRMKEVQERRNEFGEGIRMKKKSDYWSTRRRNEVQVKKNEQ
jgi:hypothetical protein